MFRGGAGAASEPRVPGGLRGRFRKKRGTGQGFNEVLGGFRGRFGALFPEQGSQRFRARFQGNSGTVPLVNQCSSSGTSTSTCTERCNPVRT